jgi:hypothetical protein
MNEEPAHDLPDVKAAIGEHSLKNQGWKSKRASKLARGV